MAIVKDTRAAVLRIEAEGGAGLLMFIAFGAGFAGVITGVMGLILFVKWVWTS